MHHRTTRLASRALVLSLVLCPAAAYAAPASRKPPPLPSVSKDPRHDAAHKPAPAGLKNASATTHGATAKLASPAHPLRPTPSKSVGSPTDGQLIGGAHLADAPYLRVYPAYAGGDVRWGTDSLVGLVDRAARNVRKQFADAVLSVGHLSKAGGGELERHASHESGRDADLGFFVKNAAGKPIYGDHMVAFLGDGTAPSWPGAHFDDARNWALVSSIVGDGHAKVTHIFVATPIRERLLAYAVKIGASPGIRSRVSEVLAQPHGALPHDDHFHVRIACPANAEKCVELPVAKRHGHHGAAVASSGHTPHPGHDAGALASVAPSASGTHHGAPAHHPSAAAAPPPARAAGRPAEAHRSSEERSEALIPSLAPAVPGLDAAVIPAPLAGVRSTWGTAKDPAPAAKADPISDPDGVLDRP